VWAEASALRSSGALIALAGEIRCPVVAVHGDHDPHPAAGVREPLERDLKDFRFLLLERCGHEPWRERHARDRFYSLLEDELAS
jgi:pimeloyl-ACP methyl ester carboxylesterase